MDVKEAVLIGAAATLILWPAALWAQGEFPLKYVEAGQEDPLARQGMTAVGGYDGAPPAISTPAAPGKIMTVKAMPPGLSAKARGYIVYVGDRPFFAVVDPVSPPRLYLDAADRGDLSIVAPITGMVQDMESVFPAVAFPMGAGAGAATAKMRLMTHARGQMLWMSAAGYFQGEVTLGGQTYRVALVDANGNGRASDVSGLSGDDKEWHGKDRLAIDRNQDGKFTDTAESVEVQWLSKTVRVRDVYYSVQVAPDASSIRLDEMKPKIGTLDLPGADVSLVLVSEMGIHALGGGDGKWALPEGEYFTRSFTLSKSDRAGEKWTLSDLSTFGALRRFKVLTGETVTLKVGPPLALKVEAASGGPGRVTLNLGLAGCGGELYSVGLEKAGGVRLPAPKVKILDGSGKVLAEGNSEYG
ncbi:MAG: hypothetical protein NTU94_02515 [Planctomycetota bacterium]|nr:hypothetical protein [Planctomycetota bacterium]